MAEKDAVLEGLEGKIGRTLARKGRFFFEVADENLPDVARHLFIAKGCRLSTATATETHRGLEVLYHFSHDATGRYYCPRVVMTDRGRPRMRSIVLPRQTCSPKQSYRSILPGDSW